MVVNISTDPPWRVTVSRVFAVQKRETGSHDARSVLSAYRWESTYVSVVVAPNWAKDSSTFKVSRPWNWWC